MTCWCGWGRRAQANARRRKIGTLAKSIKTTNDAVIATTPAARLGSARAGQSRRETLKRPVCALSSHSDVSQSQGPPLVDIANGPEAGLEIRLHCLCKTGISLDCATPLFRCAKRRWSPIDGTSSILFVRAARPPTKRLDVIAEATPPVARQFQAQAMQVAHSEARTATPSISFQQPEPIARSELRLQSRDRGPAGRAPTPRSAPCRSAPRQSPRKESCRTWNRGKTVTLHST